MWKRRSLLHFYCWLCDFRLAKFSPSSLMFPTTWVRQEKHQLTTGSFIIVVCFLVRIQPYAAYAWELWHTNTTSRQENLVNNPSCSHPCFAEPVDSCHQQHIRVFIRSECQCSHRRNDGQDNNVAVRWEKFELFQDIQPKIKLKVSITRIGYLKLPIWHIWSLWEFQGQKSCWN